MRQRVIDFVLKHRPGTNPRLGDPYRYGAFNFIIEIILDDGIVLFRFPIPGVTVYPDDKVKAEVATIRYVAEHTTIPVPHIYHWGTAGENPTGLNVPFIIMNHIPHATTVGQALDDPDFTIPSVPESEKREYLYQKMAEISLQLYSLTSDRIGSLGILDNGEYAVTSAPLSHSIAFQAVNCSVPIVALPPRDKTYSSSTEYLTEAANTVIAGLLFINEKFIESATECRNNFVARCLVRDIVRQRQIGIGEPDQSTQPNAETQTGQPREVFRLWGDDFRPENVLLNEKGAVVGVVDWEFTYFAPETYLLNPPWWILADLVTGKDGGDDETVEMDQEKLSDDVEDVGDKQDHDSFRQKWDGLVRIYLRALQKSEEKLQDNQQVRPLGKHLCSGSSEDQVVATQQPPLSQLMRQRWDENMAEHALTTSIAENFLFDKFFWDHVDESYFGENTLGGYEGRLEQLNTPSRMLVDWFAHQRVDETQAWEPKALLDQVLEQMDGKSSVLLGGQNDPSQE